MRQLQYNFPNRRKKVREANERLLRNHNPISLHLHPSHHHYPTLFSFTEILLHFLCWPPLLSRAFLDKSLHCSWVNRHPLPPNHLHHRRNHPLDCPNSTLAVKNIIFYYLSLPAWKSRWCPLKQLFHTRIPHQFQCKFPTENDYKDWAPANIYTIIQHG